MDMELLNLMKEHLPAWVISGIIIIVVILFLFKEVRETFINFPMFNFLKNKKITKYDLINHQFFVFLNHMEKYKIDRMEFGDYGRTQIFREYFKLRCKIFYDNTQKLINDDILNLSSAEIKVKILDTLYTSIVDTNKAMLDQCNNDEERFIVNFIIDKFSAYTDSSIEAFKEVVETIFDSEYNSNSNIEKLNSVLNVFLFFFIATFAESEKVLKNVNGEISGKHYNGITLK